jgi:Tetratricopeptide repeat
LDRLAEVRKVDPPHFDNAAITAWIKREPALHALPLYLTAAAIHAVIEPGETLGLSGVQIITALVDRERRRLDAAGRNAGWGERAASRLAGLAALRAGLDADTLRRLASPRLEIGLPPPEQIVDKAKALGWWENDRIPAPSPDLVAAELLRQTLLDRPDIAPEWLWETLNDPVAIEVQRLDRLAYDSVSLHGPAEGILVQSLVQAVAGNAARASTWRSFLASDELGFRLSPAGTAVAKSLLSDPDLAEADRAVILNNLSVRLSDAGDRGALRAIRDAVEIYCRLAQENPARFAPSLAGSLNNLSSRLSDAGNGGEALSAIREAVEIRHRLAQENPPHFAPDLAQSLTNFSNRLSETGDKTGALNAIREAVEIYRRLAQENPARFDPDLALSLNNLSNRLGDTGDRAGALSAIREAVEIRRRLAQENPARFDPDLAQSLNNLSNRLGDARDGPGALSAIREAVEIRRGLARENPARFNPDLALSLNNFSLRLSETEDETGALTAIREAVEIRRRLAQENPARFNPDLARSLGNLAVLLRRAGDEAGAEEAAREASTLRSQP